ncbi:MAG: phosphoenolpyruvate--protein phosphotransferase [Flexistipes sinusarabici]|uniref:Phosphoenolpyruvate-protein phosphotransferase n=1 Tax=Flexistipes sinusarabici TaxID=2352 RepID=A0A5D0MP77_FLESI|nr:phosphoenolpyruvate--protein phosphotransferase [Flexistipes sinusarabici]TYB33310.1 MAG: phosphoenolpyruvate--protein phosphotransferase [Flexistipes sinusarabici]
MNIIKGIPSSEGIVTGKCHLLDRSKIHVVKCNIDESDVSEEHKKFDAAIKKTEDYISHVREISLDKLGEDHAFIFDVYLLLLKDDMLVGETKRFIEKELVNAEYALKKVSGKILKVFNESEDEYFRERKSDVEQVVQKLLRFMSADEYESVLNIDDEKIIIAHDLTPSDAAAAIKRKVKGFAMDLGSKISHTSILARAIGIPAVVGCEDISSNVTSGEEVIIDGFEGKVIVNPDEKTREDYRNKEKRYNKYIDELSKLKDAEARTRDGERVTICSNIEINEEIHIAREYNSEGIGLYRTEYIYLDKGDISEDDQFEILKNAVLLNNSYPITVRTFDLGGEKLSDVLPHPEEVNPVMGLRAVRYSLRFKDFFKKQLKAILRAAYYGDVRIMFPMISGIEEVNICKEMLSESAEELRNENQNFKREIPIGVMVELPSLALITHLIAREVDFFSVGSNDLIQYTLGIDRNNEYVAYLYRPTHPSILIMLEKIIKDARNTGIEASVCGEIAGEPKYIPVLLGLGYRNLSMSPASILKAKMVINRMEIDSCVKLVRELKECKYARLAEEKLSKFINAYAGDVYFH